MHSLQMWTFVWVNCESGTKKVWMWPDLNCESISSTTCPWVTVTISNCKDQGKAVLPNVVRIQPQCGISSYEVHYWYHQLGESKIGWIDFNDGSCVLRLEVWWEHNSLWWTWRSTIQCHDSMKWLLIAQEPGGTSAYVWMAVGGDWVHLAAGKHSQNGMGWPSWQHPGSEENCGHNATGRSSPEWLSCEQI